MSTPPNSLNVLVVDDDADHATSLELLLRQYACEPHVCVDAKDCMALIEQLRPEVVLLELTMPGMSGFDIAYEIRRNPDLRPLRLVAVTGHGEDSDRQETRRWGFDHHLSKPVDLQALQELLKTAQRIKEAGIPPESEIRARAYAKWEAAGRPVSNSQEDRVAFWYAAQRELIEERILAEGNKPD